MQVQGVRAIISILVISGFLLTSVVIALTPVLGGYPTAEYTEHLNAFASLYSGIVGIILGFYFGRSQAPPAPAVDTGSG